MIFKIQMIPFFFLVFWTGLNGQRNEPLQVTLLDGSKVHFYNQRTMAGASQALLYTPFNLRLSERNGEKEFSFLAYRADSTSAIIGGILHFLLTWGPTETQTSEMEAFVRMRTDSSQYLAGCLPLEQDTAEVALEIGPADHPLAQMLKRSLNAVASPPVRPGSKMAASFSFSAEDAQLFSDTISDSEDWKDVFLRIHLKTFGRAYQPMPPTHFSLTKSFASCIESL